MGVEDDLSTIKQPTSRRTTAIAVSDALRRGY